MQLSQGKYGGYLIVSSNDTKQLRAGREEQHHIKWKLHRAKFRETECNYPTWTVANALMLTPTLLKNKKKKKKNATRAIKITKMRPCFQPLFWKMAPQVAQYPLALCWGIDSGPTKKEEGHLLKKYVLAKKWAAFVVKYRVLTALFPQEYTIRKKNSLHFTSKEFCKGQPLEPVECII